MSLTEIFIYPLLASVYKGWIIHFMYSRKHPIFLFILFFPNHIYNLHTLLIFVSAQLIEECIVSNFQ